MSQQRKAPLTRAAAIALCATVALGTSAGAPNIGYQVVPAAHAQATPHDHVTFDHGHLDAFNVTANGDSLHLDMKEDITGHSVRRDPSTATLVVNKESHIDNVPGLNVSGYLLPLAQDPHLLWPGWDTLGVAGSGHDSIDIVFDEVEGPGQVYLFTQGVLGQGIKPLLNDGLELKTGSVRTQAEPAHTHAYWLFTEPGTYTMKVHAEAENGTIRSNQGTYTWKVAPEPEAEAPAERPSESAPATPPAEKPTETSPSQEPHGSADVLSSGSSKSGEHDTEQDSNASDAQDASVVAEGHGMLHAEGMQHLAAEESHDHWHADAPAAEAETRSQEGGDKEKQECKATQHLVPLVRDDRTSPGVWREPKSLVFGLGDAAKTQSSESIGGIEPGQVWVIGSVQEPGVPWVGANTMDPSLIEGVDSSVKYELVGFDGPGKMEVFTPGNFGQSVGEQWFRGDGSTGSGSTDLALNTHVHPSWVFDTPGTYKVTIRQTATLHDGTTSSADATLTFEVGGQGDANEGHFDFGSKLESGCEGDNTAANGGSGSHHGSHGSNGSGSHASGKHRGGRLANTGAPQWMVAAGIAGLVLVAGSALLLGLRRRSAFGEDHPRSGR